MATRTTVELLKSLRVTAELQRAGTETRINHSPIPVQIGQKFAGIGSAQGLANNLAIPHETNEGSGRTRRQAGMLDNLQQYAIECEVRRHHHVLLGTAILRSDSSVSCCSWRTPVMASLALFPVQEILLSRFPRFRKVRRCRVKAHPKYLLPEEFYCPTQLHMPWLLPNFSKEHGFLRPSCARFRRRAIWTTGIASRKGRTKCSGGEGEPSQCPAIAAICQ